MNKEKYKKHNIWWVVITFVLTALVITFLLLWIFQLNSENNQIPCSCFGTYGVQLSVDANPISCLLDGVTGPCIFKKLSLQECNTECLNRTNCNAFTYNPTTFTMKIVEPTNTFISPLTNLFVAQKATIS